MDLPDDFCLDLASSTAKRKFQPKGFLQEKSKKSSKPSASITESGEHVVDVLPILSAASDLIDKSPPNLPSPEASTHGESNQDDVVDDGNGEDVQPFNDALLKSNGRCEPPPSDMDLPDDFCFDTTSTAVKVARKFQPKGSQQGKSQKSSKPSASSNDSGEHASRVPPIPCSASVLTEKSPPDLPSPQSSANDETYQDDDDILEDAQPFDDPLSKSKGRCDPPSSDKDLLDDFCFDPTSTAVKVSRKFQPKGSLQEKSKISSKPSASITDSGGGHAADFPPILSSASVLTDKSPPDFPLPQSAANEERDYQDDDVVREESALPLDMKALNYSLFGPSPTIDASPHYKEPHFLSPEGNGHQEIPSDPVCEFNESTQATFHAEPELTDSNITSATKTEHPICTDAESFDDTLSESIASIARGVGKFHPKPSRGGLVVKSNQPSREISDKVGDEDCDVNEEDLGNFDAFRIEGDAEKISGLEKASQNSDMNKRTSRKRQKASDESNITAEDRDVNEEELAHLDAFRIRGVKERISGLEKASQNSDLNKRPSRRRKKTSHESNIPAEDSSKKKFVHSTRRKRRQVDKSLLEMPEEEIDSRKLRIRDLIMLTEAREHLSIKSASTGISENNQRNTGHDSRSYYDRDDAYIERQDPNYEDEDANAEVDASSIKLNYHTYMKKSRREKWSKMDVELLYQAIRQFGTDFGMIQQLFPGKTRHQVHLKFKSEERKHPLQIADALLYRSKDHSHFKLVIEQLKVRAENEKTEELPSEQRDEATAMHEDESIKSLDGEDPELDDVNDDGSAVKYDYTEDAFDWDGYEI